MKQFFSVKKAAVILISSFSLFACSSDDDPGEVKFPPLNRGDIEANRLLITFTEQQDTTRKNTFEFFDVDGIGGAAPSIVDTIILRRPTPGVLSRVYTSKIDLFNGNTSVTNDVLSKDNRYRICYRGMNPDELRNGDPDLDRDGFQLGVNLFWSTIDEGKTTPGFGVVRITFNFQAARKDGTCDPGVRILEAVMPYKLI